MKNVPFFPNHPDGTHCYQAALKMVLTYFTNREWSYTELIQITGKLEGKWTWPTTSLLWLLDHGYDVRLIEEFSYEEFAQRGKDYLIKKCGEEVADIQEVNSDLPREQKLAAEVAKRSPVDFRIPSWKDLEQLFKEGYLIICNINASSLYHRKGYSGHFVVPVAVRVTEITLHDPGLPPSPSITVSKQTFEKAWAYPTEHEKNILAIKPHKSLKQFKS